MAVGPRDERPDEAPDNDLTFVPPLPSHTRGLRGPISPDRDYETVRWTMNLRTPTDSFTA